MLPIFLAFIFVVTMPLGLFAEKELKNALLYISDMFLRYLPLVGLAALGKLFFLKRKLSLEWKKAGKISIHAISTIYTELILLLVSYALLAPWIKEHVLKHFDFYMKISENNQVVEILFIQIVLFGALLYGTAVIINMIFLHRIWGQKLVIPQKFKWSLSLAAFFPIVMLLFLITGVLLKLTPKIL